MRKISILIMTSIISLPLIAQTKAYTIDECVAMSLANNQKMHNADIEVAASDEQRKEMKTKYFPTVSAMSVGFVSNKGLVQMDLSALGAPGTIGMVKNGILGGVTVMQPVFAGGQIVNGNNLAKLGAETSRLKRNLTENEIRLKTETYYWQIVMLKAKLKTMDKVETQLLNAQTDAQTAVDAGVSNRNDLLQVNLKKNEVHAQRIKLENALALSCDLLAQMMGIAVFQEDGTTLSVDVAEDIFEHDAHSPQSIFADPEISLPRTAEYKLLEKQVEASKLQHKLEIGKNLPSVAIGGGYVYNDLMNKSQNNFIGMATISIPISGWWGGSHAIKRMKMQITKAQNECKDQGEMLKLRMRSAWNDLTDSFKQIQIAKESVRQSEENLRLNADYYQAGTVTMNDLLDAQTLYQQSYDRYVEASAQYEVKKCEYLQATGR